jgi:hypothetical protein
MHGGREDRQTRWRVALTSPHLPPSPSRCWTLDTGTPRRNRQEGLRPTIIELCVEREEILRDLGFFDCFHNIKVHPNSYKSTETMPQLFLAATRFVS